jgi:RNA polymerase sigma factor (sigma-70 family)
MKITDPGTDTVQAATAGDLAALDRVLLAIQPGVFNLALRMLGRREDAADATQEILLKVVTHLGGFRGQAAFTTWVFQIARNHLLTASTRSRESPELSLDAMAERLQQGLDFAATLGDPQGHDRMLTPEDKLAARQVALSCTQNMLMSLDREQRLVYVLDVVFGLPSAQAAQVLDITPEAYRQRLSRARTRLDGFTQRTCGWAHRDAACQCERQLPALKAEKAEKAAKAADSTAGGSQAAGALAIHPAERRQAEQQFDALVRLGDAAAVFRAHPDYQAPQAQRGAVLAVLRAEGFLGGGADGERPVH